MASIIRYGNPILRKKCEDIPLNTDLSKVISDMMSIKDQLLGVGIAAPQIGSSQRVFIVNGVGVMINAKITFRSTEQLDMYEGCLSIPKIHEEVTRPENIKITYYDEQWVLHEDQQFDGMLARIIQHEYDHVEGILFIDHLSSLKRRMLSSKLKAISKM